MSETSIQARPNPAPPVPDVVKPPRAERWRYAKKGLKALASLRLTVFLFVLSMFLVFCGTLAMMDNGLFATMTQYFRSFVAWIPFQVFIRLGQVFFGFPPNWNVAGSFPFPGGWTIGAVLLFNLLAAHAIRFRFTWKRSGILILHAGIILLMLGELTTGLFSVEGNMTIAVNGSSNYVENFERLELAFVWPADAKNDNVAVVPDSFLKKGGTIANEALPIDIEVVRYMDNSTLSNDVPSVGQNRATHGIGLRAEAVPQPPGRGVDADQKRDIPAAYVALKDKKSGRDLGTYLVSPWLSVPQEVKVDGTVYQIALRFCRDYRPYTFHLKQMTYDYYHGTRLAKEFSSLVQVIDPSHDEDREVLIRMNHPLYYQGETFYQAKVSVLQTGEEYTVLQAVKNPAWPLPYIACSLVSGGMIVHFLILLIGFFRRMVTP
jgi:hypothetical protein